MGKKILNSGNLDIDLEKVESLREAGGSGKLTVDDRVNGDA